MRLMCSPDQAEVEIVRSELLKAGINVEVRSHPLAERLGVHGMELWVPRERDYFEASRLYQQIRARAAIKPASPAPRPPGPTAQAEPAMDAPSKAKQDGASSPGANDAASKQTQSARRQQMMQANSLLGEGIKAMFRREDELAQECATLQGKVQELRQALDHALAALANETEARASVEKMQAEQISGLVNTLESERQEWQHKMQALEKQLVAHKELEQQMEAHVVSLSSLCGRVERKIAVGRESCNR